MQNKDIKSYNIKLTPLSPIHIGTGETYEPINYVIELNEDSKNGRMYIFDEFEFFNKLNTASKAEFVKISNDTSSNALLNLQKFIKNNIGVAKEIAYKSIVVSPEVAKEYIQKVGKVVQKEKNSKKIINQLIIEKTFESPNLKKAIIPGSSLKGALSTAFGEMLLKNDKSYETKDYFNSLLVSDSNTTISSTFVADAVNLNRNKESSRNSKGIEVKYEAISSKSKFETTLKIKHNKFDISELIEACNNHYMPIFKSQFNYETDEFTRQALSNKFIKQYENLKLNSNQFLLRIGKHSGARAVTIDGIREIKIQQGKGKGYLKAKEETTIWLINKQPFGWLLCEIADKE
ncbi:RAMP superfamily CRISPR-associated protein [Campylobacter sp. RM15925]|uniref:RAMP superfamily CRISPR-associated protein n=1 Tax=Campylobacter sp. RM15925 TaxID=1705724 RepID=UPI0014745B13|nr:RAMP superfamily CRISPR-associated protein [Campylobacter sp. RM15925]